MFQSRLSVCRGAAHEYGLTLLEANELIDHIIDVIDNEWNDAADLARLTALERQQLWHRQFLNESIFY
jgi:serine/threonine-protein kinase HipA